MVCWYSFQKVSVESYFTDKNAVQGETMDTAKTIKDLRRRTMAKAFLISGRRRTEDCGFNSSGAGEGVMADPAYLVSTGC